MHKRYLQNHAMRGFCFCFCLCYLVLLSASVILKRGSIKRPLSMSKTNATDASLRNFIKAASRNDVATMTHLLQFLEHETVSFRDAFVQAVQTQSGDAIAFLFEKTTKDDKAHAGMIAGNSENIDGILLLRDFIPQQHINHLLLKAAQMGRLDVIEVILPRAEPKAVSQALLKAVQHGQQDAFDFLKPHSTNKSIHHSILTHCIQRNSVQFIKHFLNENLSTQVWNELFIRATLLKRTTALKQMAPLVNKDDVIQLISEYNDEKADELVFASFAEHQKEVLTQTLDGMLENPKEVCRSRTRRKI